MPAVVSIKNARKSFGEVEVLRDISLEVARVAVIGLSGGGKSTLLRCMTLLETLDAGGLSYGEVDAAVPGEDGASVYAKGDALKRARGRFGLVFQNYNLFLNKTALQNVTEPLVYSKGIKPDEARKIAIEQLDRVGLADFHDRYPSTLSGGQQQRVSIARAVAMNPELLVLDEPTSALDPEMVNGVLGVIKQLGSEGMTMLMVTHEMRFAYEASNHVVFIEGGHVVEQGDPKRIFEHPQEERTVEFLSSTNNVLMIPVTR